MISEHWTQAMREEMDALERSSIGRLLTNQETRRQ